ncbi:MAG: hypothetical protein EPN72_13705 [Nevskiaceae bacterium]|nr:MAG: hypothetical protein EPN63_14035 [Nevskiaceae bacterium]TBR71516.1 MAG: hypothetical protein EPN72_13705 [Nevskiaceae bacterium]
MLGSAAEDAGVPVLSELPGIAAEVVAGAALSASHRSSWSTSFESAALDVESAAVGAVGVASAAGWLASAWGAASEAAAVALAAGCASVGEVAAVVAVDAACVPVPANLLSPKNTPTATMPTIIMSARNFISFSLFRMLCIQVSPRIPRAMMNASFE